MIDSVKNTQIDLSPQILTLIDHLVILKDVEGLIQLRSILANLIMSNIIDKKSSFIDIAEYCDSVINTLKKDGNPHESREIKNLRLLIENDLKAFNKYI